MWSKLRLIIDVALVLAVLVLLWLVMSKPAQAPAKVPVAAQTAPEVASVPKVAVTPPKVMVYAQEAKAKVELPAAVKSDPAIAVLESDKLAESDRPETVTTVLDSGTGDTQTYVVQDPYPWLAVENNKELGLAYGFKNGFMLRSRLSFSDDLLQVKAMHVSGVATLDSDGEYFVGARLVYRW